MPGTGLSPVQEWTQRAEQDATAAARRAGVRIRAVDDEQATRLVADLGDQVWGPRGTLAPNELRALAFAGNPVHLALDGQDGTPVGFAVGFVGWAPELHVHSHQAGVVASHRRRGVGYALKLAQRSTCLAQGLDQMRWTFDPLVRRNVAFNLNALGARAVAFYPDFYGVMSDSINASDASDRLEARWDLARPMPEAQDGAKATTSGPVTLRNQAGWPESLAAPQPDAVLEIPGDYETVRRGEPERGRAWRMAVRTALTAAYGAGLRIGSVEDHGYRLVPDEEEAR